MKKTQEMLGLPIISISDGMEAGKVKGIIINSEKGAIDYIVIDSGIQVLEVRVLPAESVLGIGEYALTIENESSIMNISKVPEALDLLQKGVMVSGTGVLTKKGRLIGEIGDIYIDEDNSCSIAGLEFKGGSTMSGIRLIPRESVITFGKKLTVVNEDVESRLMDTAVQLSSNGKDSLFGTVSSSGQSVGTDMLAIDALISQNDNTYKEAVETEAYIETEEDGDDDNDGGAAILFEQRQRQYLMGRRATKTILDGNGSLIISEGAVIDDRIIDDAEDKGKLIELVMNNRA